MTLRVIAGSAKGRKLKSVPGDTTRPVTDMVKEALFNILGGEVIGSTWWDLFGGTGAIGIEALSRGAEFIRFSDLNRLPVEIMRENVNICGFSTKSEIRRGDSFAMLRGPATRAFDFLYIAPPQYKEMWAEALKLADEFPAHLTENGQIIVQIHPREAHELPLTSFEKTDERKYGSTLLIFYERKNHA
ncbi:MAG: 16S rRNA (guanine(966)-N(2))-methyltransferase RsmD [Anaerolineales bacterium]